MGQVLGTEARLWRVRWAAIGAAIAVTLGGGGIFVADALSATPSAVITTDPVRILDTRDPVNLGLAGPFVSAWPQKLLVAGTAGAPLGATGVLLNVTVVNPSAAGFVAIRPGDSSGRAMTSSLNFPARATVANSVQVALPAIGPNTGSIDITYDALGVDGPSTDMLIDVVGYLVAGTPGPAGPQGPPGPAAPGGIAPPVKSFTPTQIVHGAILTCESTSYELGLGMTCAGVKLNGLPVTSANYSQLPICSVVTGAGPPVWFVIGPPLTPPYYSWNGTNWVLNFDEPGVSPLTYLSCPLYNT